MVLRDGSTVHVRPVRPDDEPAILAFLRTLSTQSRAFRFFSASVDLEREARRSVDVDYDERFGLIATAGHGRVVGDAMYAMLDPEHAEAAFAVADDLQGRGLGTILLAHLAQAAEEAGVHVFVNQVLPENHRMIGVFRESGFPVEIRSGPGWLEVEFPASLSPLALERFERRESIAAAAALRTFLRPASIAVVGASEDLGTMGGAIFRNLAAGYGGSLYPVNARGDAVQRVPAYRSVQAIPGDVELAVIAAPTASVPDVARACGEKGVRGLIVLSGGFAEAGAEGQERQRDLVAICRETGMRLIGPNCIGVLNTDPGVRLNATVEADLPPAGGVGFLSQSGALGSSVLGSARELGLGISSFVSVGNKADISGNDVIQYWEEDEATDVILLYLESFGNPRNFARIARRVARRKPIVAVKSGRTAAGARASTSHTGAMLAGSDVTVDALFHQAGVIRTDTLLELFDVAMLLAAGPVPAGAGVGIVTNAGGPGVLCVDACQADGLEVPVLGNAVRDRLRRLLPPGASDGNPVDMGPSAAAEDYRSVVTAVAADPGVHSVIAIFAPPFPAGTGDVLRTLREAETDGVPVSFVSMAATRPRADAGIACFAFPEEAARALSLVAGYGRWRARPEGHPPVFEGISRDEGAAVIAAALAAGGGWLTADHVASRERSYRGRSAGHRYVRDVRPAVRGRSAGRCCVPDRRTATRSTRSAGRATHSDD